eukprot:3625665-Amphidinium_carterae.3
MTTVHTARDQTTCDKPLVTIGMSNSRRQGKIAAPFEKGCGYIHSRCLGKSYYNKTLFTFGVSTPTSQDKEIGFLKRGRQ